jgi:hypothetical protein
MAMPQTQVDRIHEHRILIIVETLNGKIKFGFKKQERGHAIA